MRRWFKSARMYVFVAPVAVAMSDDGGCTSTSQTTLTQEQVQERVVGSTGNVAEKNAYAYVDANGTVRGQITEAGTVTTDSGKWTLDEKGTFCVVWADFEHGENNCSQFIVLESNEFQWGGHTFTFEAGNTKGL